MTDKSPSVLVADAAESPAVGIEQSSFLTRSDPEIIGQYCFTLYASFNLHHRRSFEIACYRVFRVRFFCVHLCLYIKKRFPQFISRFVRSWTFRELLETLFAIHNTYNVLRLYVPITEFGVYRNRQELYVYILEFKHCTRYISGKKKLFSYLRYSTWLYSVILQMICDTLRSQRSLQFFLRLSSIRDYHEEIKENWRVYQIIEDYFSYNHEEARCSTRTDCGQVTEFTNASDTKTNSMNVSLIRESILSEFYFF